MKVKFNTAVAFASPSLSVGMNQIVDLPEELVKPFLEKGIAQLVEPEIKTEQAPKKRAVKKKEEEIAE